MIKNNPNSELKQKNKDQIKLTKRKIDSLSYPLISHQKRNHNPKHINYKIYHLLCNPFIYVNAYAKVVKNKGATTKGILEDDETMKYFGKNDAKFIADTFSKNSYKWKSSRRTWIPKPGRKQKRPIDTPTQKDRIVQEAIRGILESIYEPEFKQFEDDTSFKSTNYGFRPNKSCWDAVERLKIYGQSATYAIEGDIKGAYNNVDHDILLNLLSRRIKDKKFLRVIKNLLTAGIMEKDYHLHSLKGTPQGGIISPLLFNIYMFELDRYIYYNIIQKIEQNNKYLTTKQNPAHAKLGRDIAKLRFLRKNRELTNLQKNNLSKKIHALEKERFKLPSKDIKTLPKKAIYCRYADDWVLLITGSLSETKCIKEEISHFINTNLKLELDENKTLISKLTQGINFLGYTVKMYTNKQQKLKFTVQNIHGHYVRVKRRTTSRKITIYPDKERILKNLHLRKFSKPNGYSIGIRYWSIFSDYDIVLKYKQIFRGLCNYYSKCDNFYILNRISYILQYSCAKTLAVKQKRSMSQIFKKYGKNLKITKETYKNNEKTISYAEFTTLSEYRKKGIFDKHSSELDFEFDPFNLKNYSRTKMKIYLNCCICDSDQDIAMHHTNSLRSIPKSKRTGFSYLKRRINRNQIPVCANCHRDITNGKYSDKSPIIFYNEYIAKL